MDRRASRGQWRRGPYRRHAAWPDRGKGALARQRIDGGRAQRLGVGQWAGGPVAAEVVRLSAGLPGGNSGVRRGALRIGASAGGRRRTADRPRNGRSAGDDIRAGPAAQPLQRRSLAAPRRGRFHRRAGARQGRLFRADPDPAAFLGGRDAAAGTRRSGRRSAAADQPCAGGQGKQGTVRRTGRGGDEGLDQGRSVRRAVGNTGGRGPGLYDGRAGAEPAIRGTGLLRGCRWDKVSRHALQNVPDAIDGNAGRVCKG